jgi:hypothetical protein
MIMYIATGIVSILAMLHAYRSGQADIAQSGT